MVGGTGLAPARARAHEFLRLACMHSTTRRKNWCDRGDLHAHAPGGAAVFKTARSSIPHTAALVAAAGVAPARALSPAGFESAVSADSNHAAKLVQTERLALSRACAHRHLGPARMLFRHVCKMDPTRRLALRSSRYQRDASLPTLGRQKLVETEGLAPPQSVRTARLQRAAIAALPRLENWELGRESHPHGHGV